MLGPVVGAALVVGIQNYFAELGAWVTMIQGAIFVVVVMAFRRGIVGEVMAVLQARTRKPDIPKPQIDPVTSPVTGVQRVSEA
jgi:hypothetical protein